MAPGSLCLGAAPGRSERHADASETAASAIRGRGGRLLLRLAVLPGCPACRHFQGHALGPDSCPRLGSAEKSAGSWSRTAACGNAKELPARHATAAS